MVCLVGTTITADKALYDVCLEFGDDPDDALDLQELEPWPQGMLPPDKAFKLWVNFGQVVGSVKPGVVNQAAAGYQIFLHHRSKWISKMVGYLAVYKIKEYDDYLAKLKRRYPFIRLIIWRWIESDAKDQAMSISDPD